MGFWKTFPGVDAITYILSSFKILVLLTDFLNIFVREEVSVMSKRTERVTSLSLCGFPVDHCEEDTIFLLVQRSLSPFVQLSAGEED